MIIENIPGWLGWLIAAATAVTIIVFLCAVWRNGRNLTFLALTAAAFAGFVVIQAAAALSGFYLSKTIPPRFPLAPLPAIIVLLTLSFVYARRRLSAESLRIFTFLSVVRVPVEIVLWHLYGHGHVPQLMTFEGRNFDIIAGLTAPLAAWLAFRGGQIKRPWLIAWHLAAFGLLLNIMTNAILSIESPIQRFAFEQPNRGVLYFPFIWLPAVILPSVFVSHVVSLWHLFRDKQNGTA